MKKLLAGLLFAALLAPDSAQATYSCYGTRSPCPFGNFNATPLAAQPVKAEKVKKTKKKVKKKSVKKAVAKKKAPAKVYCEPAPTDPKTGASAIPAPAATMTPAPAVVPAPVEAAPVPAPIEPTPVPAPEPIKTPELDKVVPPPTDGNKIEPKLDVLPQPVPEKKSEAAPEPVKEGSLLDTLKQIDPSKPPAGGMPPANALPDIKPVEAAPKPVPDTGFPEINAPTVAPEAAPAPLQAPAPTDAAPVVEPMPAQPMKP